MMTKMEKIQVFEMKISGYTYEEIAARFNTTKQSIEQTLKTSLNNSSCRDFKCIYPNLKKWMMNHAVSPSSLYQMLGHAPTGNSTASMKMKLAGKRKMTMVELQKLVEVTDIPFEGLFILGDGMVESYAEN